MSEYYEGWSAGYHDEYPECPYEEGTEEYNDWWEGYNDGARNS